MNFNKTFTLHLLYVRNFTFYTFFFAFYYFVLNVILGVSFLRHSINNIKKYVHATGIYSERLLCQ